MSGVVGQAIVVACCSRYVTLSHVGVPRCVCVLSLPRCRAKRVRCVAGGCHVSLSRAHSHTKYDCFGIHVEGTAASVMDRRRRLSVITEVTCTWALGRVSDLERL